jgi:signal transduction histidine kinase
MIVRIMDMVQDRMARARSPRNAGRHWSLDRHRWVVRSLRASGRVMPLLSLHGRPLILRLSIVVVLPTLVATALGLLRVTDAQARDEPLAQAERYAGVSRAAVQATVALEDERDTAARAIGVDRDRLGLNRAYAASDGALAALDVAVGRAGDQRLSFTRDDLRTRLDGIDELRRIGFTSRLSATATVGRYSQIILDVIELGRTADGRAALLAGDTGVAADTAGLYDLLVATGLNSQRRALGTALLERGLAAGGERGALGGYAVLVELQTNSFRSVAGPATLDLFQVAGVDSASGDVDLLAQRIVAEEADGDLDTAVETWIQVTTIYLSKARQVIRTAIERSGAAVTALRVARADGTRRDMAIVIAVLVGAALLATGVGYGLAADLRRLRDRMRLIAEDRLPRAIAAAARPDGPGRPVSSFPPDDAATRTADEIGEVARAFEGVHAEAVRLATAQTTLRLTTAGVSRTLTRRTQELIARQLHLITELEQRQVEPKALDRLFELDHLATRIRRHSDNLLALTGAGPGWRWPQPATLTEVVQAATAATEQYRRVEVTPLPEVDVVAAEIVDMIQILAELIDNAARFSPPDQPVRVTAGWLSDGGIRIEVRDCGYGLGSRAAAILNARLARPAIEELGDERTLGLHVVAVLAARTGVQVHLIPIERGCVATVAVPARLLTIAKPPVPPAAADSRPQDRRGIEPTPAVQDDHAAYSGAR